jgi:SAM-dependent methyltransferase
MTKAHAKNPLVTYPWLAIANSVEQYVAPDYYKKLLKEYSFNGVSDLKYLENYIKELNPANVLELGCGSGRATEVAFRKFSSSKFTLVDLSERMISASKEQFGENAAAFHTQDAVDFLKKTKQHYDFVYSLWSFSHSVHQHVHKQGFDRAGWMIERTLKTFIRNNLNKGGRFFLIHFDSMSDEQRILMRQWKKVFPEFADIHQQSPSKRIIDSALLDLDNSNEIVLSIIHLRGDAITYASEDEVLETFLNFHLETYFNKTTMLASILQDVRNKIAPYRNRDGSFSIQPGCFVYAFEKC